MKNQWLITKILILINKIFNETILKKLSRTTRVYATSYK